MRHGLIVSYAKAFVFIGQQAEIYLELKVS